jgi:tRNA nucleotidyltransferase (CCA-adding enzyme)
MDIFVVGGAVRDVLLNKVPKDIDYVVVGSTPQEMINQGFKQVGADFPVFLHPETNDEYALARTERKTAVGYKGFETVFDPSITLLDDLRRRDLTINSMAVHIDEWEDFKTTKANICLIDPFSGRDDLNWHVLRHTSEAFSEDPIRVLRTARFAARYNFNITDNTLKLMSDIVHELNHVPTERIWMEFEKGLTEDYSHRMYEVLYEINAFSIEVMRPWGFLPVNRWIPTTRSELLMKAKEHKHLPTRFALIGANFDTNTFQSHCIPNECAQLCDAVTKFGKDLLMFNSTPNTARLNVIMNMRALTNQKLINDVFNVLEIIFERDIVKSSREQFADDLYAIKSINAADIAADCKFGHEIKQKLYNARLDVMM